MEPRSSDVCEMVTVRIGWLSSTSSTLTMKDETADVQALRYTAKIVKFYIRRIKILIRKLMGVLFLFLFFFFKIYFSKVKFPNQVSQWLGGIFLFYSYKHIGPEGLLAIIYVSKKLDNFVAHEEAVWCVLCLVVVGVTKQTCQNSFACPYSMFKSNCFS